MFILWLQRYAGSAIALFFSMALAATALWALARVPQFKPSAAYLTFFVCLLFVSILCTRYCRDSLMSAFYIIEYNINIPSLRHEDFYHFAYIDRSRIAEHTR